MLANIQITSRPSSRRIPAPMIDPIESESDVVPIATGKPGERSMDGTAMVEYYAPLQAWLKELGSSKPRSQAILEIGMVSSSR